MREVTSKKADFEAARPLYAQSAETRGWTKYASPQLSLIVSGSKFIRDPIRLPVLKRILDDTKNVLVAAYCYATSCYVVSGASRFAAGTTSVAPSLLSSPTATLISYSPGNRIDGTTTSRSTQTHPSNSFLQ